MLPFAFREIAFLTSEPLRPAKVGVRVHGGENNLGSKVAMVLDFCLLLLKHRDAGMLRLALFSKEITLELNLRWKHTKPCCSAMAYSKTKGAYLVMLLSYWQRA